MSSSGKITTISCQIDFRAIEPKSNSLDFQTIVPNGHTFYAAQRFNQFNLGHHKKLVIDVDKIMLIYPLQLFSCTLLPKKKKASQSINRV